MALDQNLAASIAQVATKIAEIHQEMRGITEEENELMNRKSQLAIRRMSLTKELRQEQKLLELAITRGEDPIALKLTNTEEELNKLCDELDNDLACDSQEDSYWGSDTKARKDRAYQKYHDTVSQALHKQMARKWSI